MKQPEDNKTIDMLAKRGRGRPRLEHALTPAERAKRYRERRKAEGKAMRSIMSIIRDDEIVTENNEQQNDALYWREMYEAAEARIAELEARATGPSKRRQWSYAAVTLATEKELQRLIRFADGRDGSFRDQVRNWTYGVYLAWYSLTIGWQKDGDGERLEALTKYL